MRAEQFLRFLGAVAVILRFIGDERIVLPDRHAVLAPVGRERPARERFARIPFALAVVQQRAGRELFPQPLDEFAGKNALLVGHGGEIPFRAVRIVNRNKRRFAAHGEADIVFVQIGVNRVAELLDAFPLLLGVRLGDARRFVNARHAHLETEFAFALIHRAADGRGAGRDRACRRAGCGLRPPANRSSGPGRSSRRRADTLRTRRAGR